MKLPIYSFESIEAENFIETTCFMRHGLRFEYAEIMTSFHAKGGNENAYMQHSFFLINAEAYLN